MPLIPKSRPLTLLLVAFIVIAPLVLLWKYAWFQIDRVDTHERWANSLLLQRKYGEAEKQYRTSLTLRERVRGPEHEDTLRTRANLARVLVVERKIAEAEKEYRTLVAAREHVAGPKSWELSESRQNLIKVLIQQGNLAGAEEEYRAQLANHERLNGADKSIVLGDCLGLAQCLEAQGKLKEALEFAQRVERGYPQSERDKAVRERIEGKLKEKEPQERGK